MAHDNDRAIELGRKLSETLAALVRERRAREVLEEENALLRKQIDYLTENHSTGSK